ncbi:MAG: c-type cytochrome [Thermodesulfobacteriota bacterium]
MKRNKYLLLISSLACLGFLVATAAKEGLLRPWRSIQASVTGESGPIDIRLRQIVVPGLRVVDRCVTCHVGMAPGEPSLSGSKVAFSHKPVVHDPAELGCTVCHAGQGYATEKADAHGEVRFWPLPMIPVKYSYSGCGSCHTSLKVPNAEILERGRKAFERLDCLACHRLDSRGGTFRIGGAHGMEGPDLSRVGASGYDQGWYEKHLAKSGPGGEPLWRETFAPIDETSLEELKVYLDSRVGAPGLVEAKALFHSLGCRGCHKVNGVGGDDGPDLTKAGERDPGRTDFSGIKGEHTIENWHKEHLLDPARVVPGSLMPAMGLSREQAEQLTMYIFSLRTSNLPEAFWPKDRIRVERFGKREFATDGATLYGTFCAACHGTKGQGRHYPGMSFFPSVGNPDFLALASDRFLTQTITHGRTGRRMPAWGEKEGGLRAEEIRELVSYLRALGGGVSPPPGVDEPRRWAAGDVKAGARLFETHCSGCHGPNGTGGLAVALNNPGLLAASDTYLFETIGRGRSNTVMEGFAKPKSTHPAFSSAEIEAIVSYIRTWEADRGERGASVK